MTHLKDTDQASYSAPAEAKFALINDQEISHYKCVGCNRVTDDPHEDMSKLKLGGHLSCCPERKMLPYYTAPVASEAITHNYTNYRGEISIRTISPKRIWFGATEFHSKPQMMLTAFDHDKQVDRDFAVKDFFAVVSEAERDRYKNALEKISEEFDLTTSRIRLRDIARAALSRKEQS